MDKGLLSQRYASSLFEVAHDHQIDKQVLDTMRHILWLHQHEPSFQQTLNVPVVPANEKMRLLQRVSPSDSWWLLERFFRILIRNNRLSFLTRISRAYEEWFNMKYGIIDAVLTTVFPISSHFEKLMKSLIIHATKANQVELSSARNPELIGGFILRFDSIQADASVKSELSAIQRRMIDEPIVVKTNE